MRGPGPEIVPTIPKGRITELDGLRGIAILLVLATHFSSRQGLMAYIYPVTTAGWMGVDLFFCLSGFLITGILLDTVGSPKYYVNFYGRRTVRIFPLYYAVLLLIMGASAIFKHGAVYAEQRSTWGSWLWFVFYIANIRSSIVGRWPTIDSLTPTWSLQIEEQFYLTYPWLLARIGKRRLTKALVCFIALSFAIRVASYMLGFNAYFQYTFTLCRLDSLAMGGLVAVLFRNGRWPFSAATTGRLAGVLGLIVIAGQWFGNDSGWRSGFNRSVGFTLISGAFALLLAWSLFHLGDTATACLRLKPLVYLGQISYGLYLLHLPVALSITMLLRTLGAPPVPAMLLMLLDVGGTILVATVSWYLFETPLLRLKAHFQTPGSLATGSRKNTHSAAVSPRV